MNNNILYQTQLIIQRAQTMCNPFPAFSSFSSIRFVSFVRRNPGVSPSAAHSPAANCRKHGVPGRRISLKFQSLNKNQKD